MKLNFKVSHSYSDKDEFGITANEIMEAQKNIKGIVKTISDNSQEISASSEELSATVEELTSKVENIDNEIKSINSGVQETSAASEEVTASIEEVDSSINELSQKSSEGSSNASQSKTRATSVQEKGKASIETTQALYEEKRQKALMAIENGKVVENMTITGSVNETVQGIEQVAATAQSQAELAQKLNEIVQRFKL